MFVLQNDPRHVPFTPVLDTAIYASGDSLWTTPIEIYAAAIQGKLVTLNSIVVHDLAFQNKALDLHFFDALPTGTYTANAAFNIAAADAVKWLGKAVIAAGDVYTASAVQGGNLTVPLELKPKNSNRLWVLGVSKGTGTFLANSLRFKLIFRQ